jgi:hypothetical protein
MTQAEDTQINLESEGKEGMFNYLGTSVQGYIAAPTSDLWALVSDVTRHPELAGSGQVVQVDLLTPEAPPGPGARFQSQQNINGLHYVTESQIVVYEPPYRIAWRIGLPGTPALGQIWQFVLTPQGEGTLVENGVVLPYVAPYIWPSTLVIEQLMRMEAASIEPTLPRLAELVGAPAPTQMQTQLAPPHNLLPLLPSPLVQGSLWLGGAALLAWLATRRRTA